MKIGICWLKIRPVGTAAPESLDATEEGLNPANTLNPVNDISVIRAYNY
jgi:hypothetical protein